MTLRGFRSQRELIEWCISVARENANSLVRGLAVDEGYRNLLRLGQLWAAVLILGDPICLGMYHRVMTALDQHADQDALGRLAQLAAALDRVKGQVETQATLTQG